MTDKVTPIKPNQPTELKAQYEQIVTIYTQSIPHLPKANSKIHKDYANLKAIGDSLESIGWPTTPAVMAQRQKLERDINKLKTEISSVLTSKQAVLANKKTENDDDADAKYDRMVENLLKGEAIQSAYHFGFLRGAQPKYFIHKTYKKKNKSGKIIEFTELETYSPGSMMDSFGDIFEYPEQVKYLRRLLGRHPVTVTHPKDKKQTTTADGTNRTFYRLINTMDAIVDEPGNELYNMIDLSKTMKPSGKEVYHCPWVIDCINQAISGGKLENREFWEKWVYAIVYADPGNPMLPMPVIFGEGRTGKNLNFDIIIPQLIGKSRVLSATYDVIDGNFSGNKLGKTLQFIDELPPRECWAKIKNWTGSIEQYVKIKYGPELQCDNTISTALGSNSKVYPLPFEDGKQMARVSPMKTEPGFTVAEIVFQRFHEENPNIHITEILSKLTGKTVEELPTDPFSLGDMFLKNADYYFSDKDVIQEYLDYLHTKYYQGDGNRFSLLPLRGADWEEIHEQKGSVAVKAIDHILEEEPDYVILHDVEQVYRVMSDEHFGDERKKINKNTLSSTIHPILDDAGYTKVSKCAVYVEKTSGQILKDKKSRTGLAATHSRKQSVVWLKDPDDKQQIVSRIKDYIEEIEVNGQSKLIVPNYED